MKKLKKKKKLFFILILVVLIVAIGILCFLKFNSNKQKSKKNKVNNSVSSTKSEISSSVKEVDGKYGIVNSKGQVIVPYEYTEGYDFENGIAVLVNDKGSTYFNENGVIVGLPNCALEGKVGTYNKDDYLALEDPNTGKFGFIDQKGNFKTPFRWLSATNFCNGYSLVSDENGISVIELDGNTAISNDVLYKYIAINPVFEKKILIVYKPGNSCGVLDINGNEIIECSSDNSLIEANDANIIVHKNDEQILYYNFDGSEIKGGENEN